MNTEQRTPQPDPRGEQQRTDAEQPRGARRRNLIIAGAVAAALVVVGGGAYAIGANVGDNRSDHAAVSQDRGTGVNAGRGQSGGGSGSSADPTPAGSTAAASGVTADAVGMRQAAETAIAPVNGTGATSIEIDSRGYDVEVVRADGSEVEVIVRPDGSTAQDDDGDGRHADRAIELERLGAVVDAALAASRSASGVDGTIKGLSTSNDTDVAYKAKIRLSDGREADVALGADLSVVKTSVDD